MTKAYREFEEVMSKKLLNLMFDRLNYEYKDCLETYNRLLDYYCSRLIKAYGKDDETAFKMLEAKEFIKDALDDIRIACDYIGEYLGRKI